MGRQLTSNIAVGAYPILTRFGPSRRRAFGVLNSVADELGAFHPIDDENAAAFEDSDTGGKAGEDGEFIKRRLSDGADADFPKGAVGQGVGSEPESIAPGLGVARELTAAFEPGQNIRTGAFGNPQQPADFSVTKSAGRLLEDIEECQGAFQRISSGLHLWRRTGTEAPVSMLGGEARCVLPCWRAELN